MARDGLFESRNLAQAESINRRTLGEKMAFESGHRERVARRSRFFNEHLRRNQVLNRTKIIFLIGRDPKPPVRREQSMNGFEKRRLHLTAAFMFSFRPRIGKQKMDHINRGRREQVLNGVTALDPQQPEIAQIEPERLLATSSNATTKLFDAEKIPLRKLCRQLRDEGTVSATEIDFERRDSAKKFCQIEWGKIIRGNELNSTVAACLARRIKRGKLLE